ncbi:MAG: hypothetical protein AB1697_07270 [Pseudomonadota bacterium]
MLILGLTTNTTEITDPLALGLLASRIAQSAVHLYSTSETAVKVRFVFFLAQYFIEAYWTLAFLGRFLG